MAGGIADEDTEENLPTRQEICRNAFHDVKDQLKYSDVVLVDDNKELKKLAQAAERCAEAVKEGQPRAVKEATKLCQMTLDELVKSSSEFCEADQTQCAAKERSRQRRGKEFAKDVTLHHWRPGGGELSTVQGNLQSDVGATQRACDGSAVAEVEVPNAEHADVSNADANPSVVPVITHQEVPYVPSPTCGCASCKFVYAEAKAKKARGKPEASTIAGDEGRSPSVQVNASSTAAVGRDAIDSQASFSTQTPAVSSTATHVGRPALHQPLPSPGVMSKKEEADALAKDGDFLGALTRYEDLLVEVEAAQVDLRVALLSNAALCSLRLSTSQANWTHARQLLRRALRFSTEATDLDRTHAKSHFRRGCALESMEQYAEACEAYEEALHLEPTDARIKAALTRTVRYLQFSQGPERAGKIERLARGKKNFNGKSSLPGPGKKENATLRYGGCCRCYAEVQGEGYFAVPCGHGPFCGQCKASMDREGKVGFALCTVCKQHPATTTRSMGMIERWEVGLGQLIQTHPAAAKELAREALSTMGRPLDDGDENIGMQTAEKESDDITSCRQDPSSLSSMD